MTLNDATHFGRQLSLSGSTGHAPLKHADCFGAFDPKAKSGKADGDSIADGGRPYVQRDPPKTLHVAELVYLLTSGQPPSDSGRNASSAGMVARTLK
jgi:hypothetical protein